MGKHYAHTVSGLAPDLENFIEVAIWVRDNDGAAIALQLEQVRQQGAAGHAVQRRGHVVVDTRQQRVGRGIPNGRIDEICRPLPRSPRAAD